MTREEQAEVVRRAREAGHFDDLAQAWFNGEAFDDVTPSPGDHEIARAAVARAEKLLGERAVSRTETLLDAIAINRQDWIGLFVERLGIRLDALAYPTTEVE